MLRVFDDAGRALNLDGKAENAANESCLSGWCHPMAVRPNKTRNATHSTSAGETKRALSVVSNSQMMVLSIAEMQMDSHLASKDQ